ncbi:hypothetical protein RJ640_024149 [Escallonia rubra]|uniref:Uncharacterized protein n=1 Tax=Escallonia rubra TaxID=112253 RepID=A0AA88UIR7_9ASTE|nr:hypothetical protein RJ640_024149 [Escallonia rubra]
MDAILTDGRERIKMNEALVGMLLSHIAAGQRLDQARELRVVGGVGEQVYGTEEEEGRKTEEWKEVAEKVPEQVRRVHAADMEPGFQDWVDRIESYFDWKEVQVERKVKLVGGDAATSYATKIVQPCWTFKGTSTTTEAESALHQLEKGLAYADRLECLGLVVSAKGVEVDPASNDVYPKVRSLRALLAAELHGGGLGRHFGMEMTYNYKFYGDSRAEMDNAGVEISGEDSAKQKHRVEGVIQVREIRTGAGAYSKFLVKWVGQLAMRTHG